MEFDKQTIKTTPYTANSGYLGREHQTVDDESWLDPYPQVAVLVTLVRNIGLGHRAFRENWSLATTMDVKMPSLTSPAVKVTSLAMLVKMTSASNKHFLLSFLRTGDFPEWTRSYFASWPKWGIIRSKCTYVV